MIARHVVAGGEDAARIAGEIVEGLRAPDLRVAFVFADWRLDPHVLARTTHAGLAPAVVVGGTTTGVVGPTPPPGYPAIGLGLYGDWLRVGVGVAADLSKSALTRSRDAVYAAAAQLGLTGERLDPSRHVGITVSEGGSGDEESFCIGSAAAAPQIRFVGGCASTAIPSSRKPALWVGGEVMGDAGVILVLDSELPCHVVTSSHLVPTEVRTVVTAAAGRTISELDGHPAASHLERLLGGPIGDPPRVSFARYIDGVPYVRSIMHREGEELHVASTVEVGHVLRVMRSGDLIGQTRKDLATAAEKVGGTMATFLACSCMARHWEAAALGLEGELAAVYAAYPTAGFQSFGEQSGMLLVNHTLTGLAIGRPR